MTNRHASHAAQTLLTRAARQLHTPDPLDLPDMKQALDQSLDWSLD